MRPQNAFLLIVLSFILNAATPSAAGILSFCGEIFRKPKTFPISPRDQCEVGSCWVHAINGSHEARLGFTLSDSYIFTAGLVEKAIAQILHPQFTSRSLEVSDGGTHQLFLSATMQHGSIPKEFETFDLWASERSLYYRLKEAIEIELFELLKKILAYEAYSTVDAEAKIQAEKERVIAHLRNFSFPTAGFILQKPGDFRIGRRIYSAQSFAQKYVFNSKTHGLRTITIGRWFENPVSWQSTVSGINQQFERLPYQAAKVIITKALRLHGSLVLSFNFAGRKVLNWETPQLGNASGFLKSSPRFHAVILTKIKDRIPDYITSEDEFQTINSSHRTPTISIASSFLESGAEVSFVEKL